MYHASAGGNMKIVLDDQEYVISQTEQDRLLQQVHTMFQEQYAKLDLNWRLLVKPVAREILRRWEMKARDKHGPDVARAYRPEKQGDPVTHLAKIIIAVLQQEALKHVQISVTTEHNTVTNLAISIKNPAIGGGQMAANGDIGLRENHGPEVP